MQISEKSEEALEVLWVTIVEKGKKVVSNKVIRDREIIKELKKNGLIEVEESRITLTEKGRGAAEGVIRRHRLAERLFHDFIKMDAKKIEEPACKFEHILISGEIEEGVCTLLGHPRECPHGRSIPRGRCCKERRQRAWKVIRPLSEMKSGGRARVVYIQTRDHQKLQKLMAMGVLPGRVITLIQRVPSYVFSIGRTQIAVDKEIASEIYVRLERE